MWLVSSHFFSFFFALHKAGESHFVNKSDVWLSPLGLMSDEALASEQATFLFWLEPVLVND